MTEGEVEEIGAIKNGVEVQAAWTSSNSGFVDVLDGGVLAIYKDTNNTVTTITSSYNGENAETLVTVLDSPLDTRTGFKVLEMNMSTQVTYTLEFLNAGTPVANTSLHFLNSHPDIAVVDSDGNVAGLAEGKTLITVLYNGKKYGHMITVSNTVLAADKLPETTKKIRSRKS